MASALARFMRFTAKPGKGDELAATLGRVAEHLGRTPGCELYAIGRREADGEPDVVTVTELWRSAEAAEAAIAASEAEDYDGPTPDEVMALVDGPPQRTDSTVVAGKGVEEPEPGHTHRNVEEFEDLAPGFGMQDTTEARFPTEAAGAVEAGFSHQRIKPGARSTFGHVHRYAEELYFVISGTGTANLDGELVPLAARDVLRVGPAVKRAFEAGDEGLEFLAFGRRRGGDGEVLPGWWG
jgi:quinol monooxygenase YgiN/mannose-6-phosphate isomerase-like protein (cupin superfamily)